MRRLMAWLLCGFVLVGTACTTKETVSSDSGPAPSATSAQKESSTSSSSAGNTSPKDPAALYLSGPVTIPAGDSGLSVVYVGTSSGDFGSTVPVIVRNNTQDALRRVEISGTARDAAGTLVGSGSSQQFEPAVLEPGAWGFGSVYFSEQLPPGATFDFTAKGDEVGTGISVFTPTNVTVAEISVQPRQYGGVSFIGIVSNDSGEDVDGPISVAVGCFDAVSNLVAVFSGYTEGSTDTLASGATDSFSIDTYSSTPECAVLAVGASGYVT